MAITRVNANFDVGLICSYDALGSQGTLTFPLAPTAGDLMVAAIGWTLPNGGWGGADPTFSFVGMSGWAFIQSAHQAAHNGGLIMAYKVAGAGEPTTLTVRWDTGAAAVGILHAYRSDSGTIHLLTSGVSSATDTNNLALTLGAATGTSGLILVGECDTTVYSDYWAPGVSPTAAGYVLERSAFAGSFNQSAAVGIWDAADLGLAAPTITVPHYGGAGPSSDPPPDVRTWALGLLAVSDVATRRRASACFY